MPASTCAWQSHERQKQHEYVVKYEMMSHIESKQNLRPSTQQITEIKGGGGIELPRQITLIHPNSTKKLQGSLHISNPFTKKVEKLENKHRD